MKKETLAQVFSYEFCEILRTPFYRTPLVAAPESLKIYYLYMSDFPYFCET